MPFPKAFSNPQQLRPWRAFCLLLLIAFPCAATPATAPDDPLALPASTWAAQAAHNELSAINYSDFYVRYRIHMVNAKGDQVRDVLESKDGTVARLILRDSRPLTPEEDAAEHTRLQEMLDSPSAFAHHVKGDQTGKKLAADLVKLFPDAMLFTYVDGQPQRPNASHTAPPELVIDFKPNPAWVPPTIASEALTGLEGRAWIDSRSRHLTRLDGQIVRPVNFGFGMLARIAPGGVLSIEQAGLSDTRWIFTHFSERITLRALMVKTIKENSNIDASDFAHVPAMTYQEAIKTLLATPLPH